MITHTKMAAYTSDTICSLQHSGCLFPIAVPLPKHLMLRQWLLHLGHVSRTVQLCTSRAAHDSTPVCSFNSYCRSREAC